MRCPSGTLCIFHQSPGDFPYVFIITREVTTLEPIYGTTITNHRVFVFGETSRFLIVLLPFEVCLYTIPPTDLLDTFTETLCVGYDSVTLGFIFIGSRLGTCNALVVSPIRSLPRRPIKPSLYLVQSSYGVFALC